MKIILLIPILAYLLLVLVNLELLKDLDSVNLFGANIIKMPVLLFNTLFIVLYSILVFFVYDGLNSYLHYKIRKLDKEIVGLKSDLYDNQESLISIIKKDNLALLEKIKLDNKDIIKYIDERNEKNLELCKNTNKENIEKK